jgi:hypothetical protein
MQNPPRHWPGGSLHPHFLIVPLGTTNSVTQATHGLGKFAAAPVVSPFELPPNQRPERPHKADHACFTPNRRCIE